MRIECTFHPQAWSNNYAIDVDPEGPTSWTTVWPDSEPLPKDDSYESDDLARDQAAPEWVQNWRGPFWVEITACAAAATT